MYKKFRLNVLVTGGQGFLGRHVASKLSQSNNVTTIGSQNFDSHRIPHLQCDLLDYQRIESLVKSIDSIDCIVHTAGHSRELDSIANPIKYFDQNLLVTLNILEIARKFDAKRFVYSSTYLVYGDNNGDRIKEDHPLHPKSVYAGTKAAGENLCLSYGYSYGIDVTVFRQGLFYGEDDNKRRVISYMLENARQNKTIEVFGEKVIDFIHVDDSAMAYHLLLSKDTNGIFNIASGKGANLIDIANFIKARLNPNIEIQIHERRQTDIPHFIADISKAKEQIGLNPTTDLFDFLHKQT